jgi:hypothetical protein
VSPSDDEPEVELGVVVPPVEVPAPDDDPGVVEPVSGADVPPETCSVTVGDWPEDGVMESDVIPVWTIMD